MEERRGEDRRGEERREEECFQVKWRRELSVSPVYLVSRPFRVD